MQNVPHYGFLIWHSVLRDGRRSERSIYDVDITGPCWLFMTRLRVQRSSLAENRLASSSMHQSRVLSSFRAFYLLIMGVGLLAAVMGCVSTEDRERMALSKEFDKWLGQYKDHRIIEKGPPDRCVGKDGGTEICEWRVDGNSLRYLYDANGIARRWRYADPRLGEMKGVQVGVADADQSDEYHETLWKDVKDTIDDIHFAPASGR